VTNSRSDVSTKIRLSVATTLRSADAFGEDWTIESTAITYAGILCLRFEIRLELRSDAFDIVYGDNFSATLI